MPVRKSFSVGIVPAREQANSGELQRGTRYTSQALGQSEPTRTIKEAPKPLPSKALEADGEERDDLKLQHATMRLLPRGSTF